MKLIQKISMNSRLPHQHPHLNPLPQGEADATRPVRAFDNKASISRWQILALVCIAHLIGCESTSHAPPPVTSQMARVGTKQHVDLATLHEGRRLFVSRCIECHTLPTVSAHSAAEWPRLIDEMAGRANLKPAERNAVLAYILAARDL
jgi:cytochrome c5